MKASAVIGANFGDEGKGLMTDYLASKSPHGITVRFNGGAQAGHTVVTPDGTRHVFNHIGAGTFAGQTTFLSRFFITNPIIFFKEYKVLSENFMGKIDIVADPAGLVTTPYDMLINQIVEDFRGKNRHGSVGIGIGETIERNLQPEYAITIADLNHPNLRTRLDIIRREYVPIRLEKLGVTQYNNEYIMSDGILENFVGECYTFCDNFIRIQDVSFLKGKEGIVFEGAQGLLLDQDHRFFPYVTRSKTGLANVLTLAEEAGITEIDTHYITRAYLTRHGAGPLPHEIFWPPYPGIVDKTNIMNKYQGSLRFSWLNIDLLKESILKDLEVKKNHTIKVNHMLGMTCLDQINGDIGHIHNGDLKDGFDGEVFDLVRRVINSDFYGYMSFGPTREHIIEYKAT
jgi:adenylosuccinate synthase